MTVRQCAQSVSCLFSHLKSLSPASLPLGAKVAPHRTHLSLPLGAKAQHTHLQHHHSSYLSQTLNPQLKLKLN